VLPFLGLSFIVACSARTDQSPRPTDGPVVSTSDPFIADLQERTFRWFWDRTNPTNGLVPDRAPTQSFSSVAAIGFGLAAYTVGVERRWVTRTEAAGRTLTTLRFLYQAPQGPAATAVTGYKGFFYHFLDMQTGHRFEQVELSTIDTALLLGGVLICREFFDGGDPEEQSIRAYADSLYWRVDWQWAVTRPPRVSHGWKPEVGYLPHDWSGPDESAILYILALGSPTFPIDTSAWTAFSSTNVWDTFYGYEYLQFAPLFGHQYTQTFVDLRGIRDPYMRARNADYFESSRRATLAHRAYATENPNGWRDYSSAIWGLTAADGPADVTLTIDGRQRVFKSYAARGVSSEWSHDDGTLAPTALGGSIAFAPEVVVPALKAIRDRYGEHIYNRYGFLDSFNPTFRDASVPLTHGTVVPNLGWFDTDQLGIDQGPIVIMIENWRSGLSWRLSRRSPYIIRGLRRAGFTGGWIDRAPPS
jgi:hypothetical protein